MEWKLERSDLPRATLNFVSKLRDYVLSGHILKMANMFRDNALSLCKTNKERAASENTLHSRILSQIKIEVDVFNDSCDAWKGVARNKPFRLICGSGSSHIWISPQDQTNGSRIAIIYLD